LICDRSFYGIIWFNAPRVVGDINVGKTGKKATKDLYLLLIISFLAVHRSVFQ